MEDHALFGGTLAFLLGRRPGTEVVSQAGLRCESNAKHLRHAGSIIDHKGFPGRSRYSVIGGEGWEEVADYAQEWATDHAARPATRARREN